MLLNYNLNWRRRDENNDCSPTLYFAFSIAATNLSQTIQVETNAALTTQGKVTDPVIQFFLKRIVLWLDFPQIQEQIWKKFERAVGLVL